MQFPNAYFINGTAYAGKSTMVQLLAEKYGGICCGTKAARSRKRWRWQKRLSG